MKQRNKGITLIALVITIIVLLILAAVSIATLTGENGILTKAQEAKVQNAKSQAEEEVKLAVASLLAEEAKRKMTQEEKRQFLENELKQYNSSSTVAIDGDRFLAKHREYKIEIDEKYKVSIKEPFNPEVWDKTATPEDAFIWQSDDQNSEEYGVVIGYNEKVENYTTVRFPSRCTEIELLGLYDEEGVYQGTTRGFTNNILKVEIPGTVHTIGTWAFGDPHASSFQALEEIVMEEGVTNIERAFENCSNLRDITIPNTVNYIENVAFLNTAWYNEQPDGVVYAGKVAYKYKGTMPSNTEITLKEDTVGISQDAFSYCTNLRSINIPESVRNIGSYAFSNCGLISITISEGVTNIETSAFSGCTGLSSISFPDSITSIGVSAFKDTAWYDNQSDGLIYIGKVVYKYKGTMPSDTSITLNEDTVGIAGDAFRSCTGLTNINIPESVTNIGESAFNSCTGLTNIIIPESVTTIGASTFSGCRGLTNIIIPRTVTRIGSYAFGYWEETQTINCIIESKPAGWDSGWDGYSSPSYGYYGYQPAVARKANLVWGYTGQ